MVGHTGLKRQSLFLSLMASLIASLVLECTQSPAIWTSSPAYLSYGTATTHDAVYTHSHLTHSRLTHLLISHTLTSHTLSPLTSQLTNTLTSHTFAPLHSRTLSPPYSSTHPHPPMIFLYTRYGGLLAMHNADGLSPGKLITYQLYWNMMTGAYKGLLDILTSFTRAGGAATRVFALIDSMPDIDVNAGTPLGHDTLPL